ncbi:MAG TPA: hypothetical protein VKS79_09615 [Gemmataceae bacterium]|nr:hypothetical protein [Gemmataceae bacterium]
MSISVKCSCGRTLLLRPEFAGKRVKCPICKGSLQVPNEEPKDEIVSDFEVVEDNENVESNFEIVEQPQKPSKPSASAIIATRPVSKKSDNGEDPPPRPPKPKRRKRSRARYYDDYPEPERRHSGGGLAISQGVIAGVAMMAVSLVLIVVMFVFLGRIWIYPGIIFALGIVRIVRSIVHGDDDGNWWW